MTPPAIALLATWLVFGAAFVFRPKSTGGSRRREPRAWLGIAIQAMAYAVVWYGGFRSPAPLPVAVQWLGVGIGVASALLAWSAVRHLGQQWAVQARIVEGHELITTGPYAHLRHPIYTGMLGMLIATGCVGSTWVQLGAGSLLFVIGTWSRTRYEEALLHQEFGDAFEDYRRRTGWLLPRL